MNTVVQNDENLLFIQQQECQERGYPYVSAGPDSKLGFAIRTEGSLPVNGLRHPPSGDTNGWYILYPDAYSPLARTMS